MLSLPRSVRIFLASQPVDMRKSIDGLMAIIRQQWSEDVFSGHLFVFANRKRDRIKILYWDKSGFAIWMKKQESDCTRPRPFTGSLGHTDNFARRPFTAGGVGSDQESSHARRRPMSRSGSDLAPPRARRLSGRQRATISGVC